MYKALEEMERCLPRGYRILDREAAAVEFSKPDGFIELVEDNPPSWLATAFARLWRALGLMD